MSINSLGIVNMKIILFILLVVCSVSAQTRSEFLQRYESPEIGIYILRPGIFMSVDFSVDTLWKDYACEAVIKHQIDETSSANNYETISSKLAVEIIDEVVPEAQRGKLIFQWQLTAGCNSAQMSEYENVEIRRTTRCKARTYQAFIKWKSPWCKYDKK